MNVITIIPARGGSKVIPRKNIMDFCGKPLIVWSIEQARRSDFVGSVYVTSDNDEILHVSENVGAIPIKRPEKFATDTASTEEALLHALGYIEFATPKKIDAIVLLQATSPLRMSNDVDEAIRTFVDQKADSLFSAALLDDCCIWKNGKESEWESITFDYKNRGRRQDRKPLFLENGSIYVFRPDVLRKHHNRLGEKISVYLMSFWQSYEIDKPEDVAVCEYFMKNNVLKTL